MCRRAAIGNAALSTGAIRAVVGIVVALAAGCAAQRPSATPLPAAGTRAADAVEVVVRVFSAWSPDPWIVFDVRQRAGDALPPPPPPPGANRMDAPTFAAWLARTEREHPDGLRAAPRVLTRFGAPATIEIGAAPGPFHAIVVAPHPADDPDDPELALVEVRYDGGGFGVRRPAADFADGDRIRARVDGLALRPGETRFVLAHGMIGAPVHLLAVTRER